MTRFEQLQQSLRLHLTVAERAARMLHDEAVAGAGVLDGVEYHVDEDEYVAHAAPFDTRVILDAVLKAEDRVNSLQQEPRHEEPRQPAA
jgi:hypothetical protein